MVPVAGKWLGNVGILTMAYLAIPGNSIATKKTGWDPGKAKKTGIIPAKPGWLATMEASGVSWPYGLQTSSLWGLDLSTDDTNDHQTVACIGV